MPWDFTHRVYYGSSALGPPLKSIVACSMLLGLFMRHTHHHHHHHPHHHHRHTHNWELYLLLPCSRAPEGFSKGGTMAQPLKRRRIAQLSGLKWHPILLLKLFFRDWKSKVLCWGLHFPGGHWHELWRTVQAPTLYGPTLHTIPLDMDNNTTFNWHVINPFAMLRTLACELVQSFLWFPEAEAARTPLLSYTALEHCSTLMKHPLATY